MRFTDSRVMPLTKAVNRKDLAQQVPALMNAHPLLKWHVHDLLTTTNLIVDLWLHQDPKRRGQVIFNPNWELITSNVLGHEDIHPEETSSDGVTALRSAIDRTGLALIGPTQFTLTYAAGAVVSSSMSVNFSDDFTSSSSHHLGRRMRGLLRGDVLTKTVNEYWPRVEPPTPT
ncbi:MAG: hypothetical protein ABI384_05075 [Allobranchiibius sp.]